MLWLQYRQMTTEAYLTTVQDQTHILLIKRTQLYNNYTIQHQLYQKQKLMVRGGQSGLRSIYQKKISIQSNLQWKSWNETPQMACSFGVNFLLVWKWTELTAPLQGWLHWFYKLNQNYVLHKCWVIRPFSNELHTNSSVKHCIFFCKSVTNYITMNKRRCCSKLK